MTSDEEARLRNDESIREALDRKPSPYPNLLMSDEASVTAYLEPTSTTVSGLIEDYFRVAKETTAKLQDDLDADQRIVPILFLYRHAVELALKYSIALTIHKIRQREPDIQETVPENHKLCPLVGTLRGLHRRAQPYLKDVGKVSFLSPQAVAFISEIDRIDPSGMTFRYVHSKLEDGSHSPLLTSRLSVGLAPLVAGMLHIEKELTWYCTLVETNADLYEQWRFDVMSDVEP